MAWRVLPFGSMRTIRTARFVLVVLAALCASAVAQPITGNGGLQRVIHDGTLSGDGTAPHPLSTIGGSSITGTLTLNRIPRATGTHTIGDGFFSDDNTTYGAASKFTITEANGNTHIYGTGTVDGATTINNTLAVVNGSSGALAGTAGTVATVENGSASPSYVTIKAGSTQNAGLLFSNSTSNADGYVLYENTARQLDFAATNLQVMHLTSTRLTDDVALTVTGLSTLTGGFSAGAQSDMTSHKIVNLTNGSSAQDAAAFGQISTAVNAAVSGVSPHLSVFTGANTLGTASVVDNLVSAKTNGSRQDVLFGNGGSYDLSVTGSADNNANAYLFQNAYENFNTGGDATLKWQGTHASFGSRGIAFKFGDGISFYADNVATTANSSFTPTRRMFISNAGGVTVDQTLGVTGATTLSSTAHIVGALTEDSTIGIGTTPSTTLIDARNAGTANIALFYHSGGNGTYTASADTIEIRNDDQTTAFNLLHLDVANATNKSLVFTSAGKLGIDMTPTNTVDIAGTLGVTGATTLSSTLAVTSTTQLATDGSNTSVGGSLYFTAATDNFLFGFGASSGANQNLHIDAGGTGVIKFNDNVGSLTHSGTGGLALYGGNNSSTQVWTVGSDGHQINTLATTANGSSLAGIESLNSATFNTTGAPLSSYGAFISNSSAISSGSNTLNSFGLYVDDTTSGANTTVYSLYTDHGDVRLNATNGITGVKGPFQVDNTNSSATDISSQINYTRTARAADITAEVVSQTGTVDLTAASRTSYGIKVANSSGKSAGNNSFSVYGVYVDLSGATSATSLQGIFSNAGDIAVASSNTTTHELKVNGHENTGGTALVNGDLSSCGTGTPTVGTGSTDEVGTITEGTTATACTLTFKGTYTVAPFCTCSGGTSADAAISVWCTTTATTMVVHNASATGDKITFICTGQRGGS